MAISELLRRGCEQALLAGPGLDLRIRDSSLALFFVQALRCILQIPRRVSIFSSHTRTSSHSRHCNTGTLELVPRLRVAEILATKTSSLRGRRLCTLSRSPEGAASKSEPAHW